LSRGGRIIDLFIIIDIFSLLFAKVIFTLARSLEFVRSSDILANDVDLSTFSGELKSILLNVHENLSETKLVTFYKHVYFREVIDLFGAILLRDLCLREIIKVRNETHILRVSLVLLNHNQLINAFLDVKNLIALIEGSRLQLSEAKQIFNI
jgi:hypothetical protein